MLLAAQKPDRRLIGIEPTDHWQNGIRKIAVDVKSARHWPLVKEREATVTTVASLTALKISVNTPTVITLDFNQYFYGEIIGIKTVNTTENPASVSLHRGTEEAALSAHESGKQLRKVRVSKAISCAGHQLRQWQACAWASSEADTVLEIERFMLFSRA